MTFDVFISYPHQDKATADAASAKLEAEGIRCWIASRDIAPSTDWAAAVVDAIDSCHVMVLIFSAHANRSRQVGREVERAFEKEKPVVPFRIENVAPEKGLAYYMASVHWLDALTPPIEQHLQELVETVKAILQVDPTVRASLTGSYIRQAPGANELEKGISEKFAFLGSKKRPLAVGLVAFALLSAVLAINPHVLEQLIGETASTRSQPIGPSVSVDVSECDRLAAGPSDTTRPVGISGVEPNRVNPVQAVPACRAALALRPEDPRIAYQLSRALMRVGDQSTDLEAVRLLLAAADAGHAAAMNGLGVMYQNGRGVARNEAEALRWYQKASDAGDTMGMDNLGGMLATGRGGAAKNLVEALRWYRKSASTGNVYAMISLGTMYQDGAGVAKDEAEAARWYLRAANADNSYAMTALGIMYRIGSGVPKDDTEAARWFRKAAADGNALAMTYLGYMYRDGSGIPKDAAEAIRWFRKAADANPLGITADGGSISGPAMTALGVMYRDGTGVAKDQAEAARWFRKASEGGNAPAMTALGVMYWDGTGVAKDQAEAVRWLRKAAAAGDKDAVAQLKKFKRWEE